MKAIYQYEKQDNEVELLEDGRIQIGLVGDDCLFHEMEKEDAKELFEAMKIVFW